MVNTSEINFSKAVRIKLHLIPKCWFLMNEGRLGFVGLPDIMGVVNGRFFAFELKRSNKARQRHIQKHFLKKIVNCGGYAKFVTPENIEECLEELKGFLYKGDI